jgi:hypothetical protein
MSIPEGPQYHFDWYVLMVQQIQMSTPGGHQYHFDGVCLLWHKQNKRLSLEAFSIISIAYGFETIDVWFRYSYGISVMSPMSADDLYWLPQMDGWRVLLS